MMTFSDEQLRWFRWRRSGLDKPFDTPEQVAAALIGVQAQILPASALAIWHRTPHFTYAQFDQLLHHSRLLVKLWTVRSTLHIHPAQEWDLIYGATWPGGSSYYERQIKRLGGDLALFYRGITQVTELLQQRGTLTRSDLRAANIVLGDNMLSSWGGVFSELVHRGLACHAGQQNGEGLFAWREYWLPELTWQPPDYATANRKIIHRYWQRYAPASELDFRHWRGVYAGTTRPWFADLAPNLVQIQNNGQSLWLFAEDLDELYATPPAPEDWGVRLLYRFDPLLLAHKDKSWLVDAEQYKTIWQKAGHIEATIIVHGRIAGSWRYDRKGNGLVVTLSPFAELPSFALPIIEQQAQGIAEFFDLPLNDLKWVKNGK